MKFIIKKQTGGLIGRYLKEHQYSLNTPTKTSLPVTQSTTSPAAFTNVSLNTEQAGAARDYVKRLVNTIAANEPATPTADWQLPISTLTPVKPAVAPIVEVPDPTPAKLVTKPKSKTTSKPKPKVTTQTTSKSKTTPVSATTKSTPVTSSKPTLKPKSPTPTPTSVTTKTAPASKSEVTYKAPDLPVTEVKATRLKPKATAPKPNNMKLTNAQVVSIANHIDRFDLNKMLPADANRVRLVKKTLDKAKAK